MISHVYISAVLMLAALPVVLCQCTTSRCQDSKYEPPRWENGAVYLESLLAETSKRILSAVESRLIELTANMATSHAQLTAAMETSHAQLSATMKTSHAQLTAAMEISHAQLTATIESRLAQHAEAVDERLATLKTELENSTIDRLEALGEGMVVETRNHVTNSESRLNLTIGAMMNSMERRLADQTGTMESRLAGLATTLESRLAVLTGTIDSRLADYAEAVNERLTILKTDLKNTTTNRHEALEERMVVENRNPVNNSESRLNLTIGVMMKNMEERIRYDIWNVSHTTEIQLKEVQTHTNVTVGAVLRDLEASLTALCSPQGSDQLNASYNCSTAQLQILRPWENEGQVTFLRRVDGSVNFQRNWAVYKSGFGDDSGFWLGLETLHQLTTQYNYGLRVDMEDWTRERKWASYQSFRVGSETGNYVLTVSGYNTNSTAGDSMTYHNGMAFTTVDRDNDGASSSNCAASHNKGGWWYNNCHYANPTGLYKPAGYRGPEGINWHHAYSDWRSFKSMSLKLVAN